jgi:hypothetical protein
MKDQALVGLSDLQTWIKANHIKLTVRWLGNCRKMELVVTSSQRPTMRLREVHEDLFVALAKICTQVKERLKSHAD